MASFTDTSLDAEALQLELVRKASPARRFELMSSFSSTLRKASLKNLEQRLSPLEARLEWMRLHYGETIAQKILDTN
jgi:phage gpG-like protein